MGDLALILHSTLRAKPRRATPAGLAGRFFFPALEPRDMAQRTSERNCNADAIAAPWAVLADDDVDFALAAADVLRGSGFVVEFVADGERALERALGSTPDVVLLDQQMPRMTGGEVFAALEAAGFRAPVVLMTAAEDLSALRRATGARYVLGKPFDAEDLLRTLHHALSGREAR